MIRKGRLGQNRLHGEWDLSWKEEGRSSYLKGENSILVNQADINRPGMVENTQSLQLDKE